MEKDGFGYKVGQPTPSFRAELALDPESRRPSKLLDENRSKLKPSPQNAKNRKDLIEMANGKLGEYEVVRKIGQGAMGEVFEARMPLIDEVVAIKVLNVSEFPADEREELRKRFVREASLLWKINHPHVIGIYHVGAANGVPYFVMEYLPTTLKNKMGFGEETRRARVRMEEREVVRIAKSLLSALECLHDAGGVHRDVKPENILFTKHDEPKLADFGIAKWSDRNLKTQTGFAMGSTDYMAPEQCDAGKADCRADIYAVGIVIYEILTGLHPFRTRFQNPSALRPDIHKGWDDLVRKATEPSPQDRFQSALEMARALEKLHRTVTNRLGMDFVWIPPGEFLMGSPEDEPGRWDDEKQHRVRLTKGFYMQTTPVTRGQWRTFATETHCLDDFESYWKCKGMAEPEFEQEEDHPVCCVSWNEVRAFIDWLNRKEGVESYDLPTEAQWEYACRAGTQTVWFFGSDEKDLERYSWFEKNSVDRTRPVGKLGSNPWGLHDMHGNVLAWCLDHCEWDSGNYRPITDTYREGLEDSVCREGSRRVVRGGSWADSPRDCRAALRAGGHPGGRDADLGFRLVLLPGRLAR